MGNSEWALREIKQATFRTLGCTDPVAVALAATTAYRQVPGEVEEVVVTLDRNIYKNAMYVNIPGTKRSGISFAIALGIIGGKPEKELLLLDDINPDDFEAAEKLEKSGIITLQLDPEAVDVHIHARVVTTEGVAETLISGSHDNIVSITKNGSVIKHSVREGITATENKESGREDNKKFDEIDIYELFETVQALPPEQIRELKHGIEVNLAAAEAGLAEDAGMKLGRTLQNMIHNGVLEGKLLNTVKMYAAAATDARMGGLKVPIIGLGGSGNHGITYFITVGMAAQVLGLPRDEKLDRALALGILIVRAIKYYTGVLTPMCGCAVAAGAGAAAAITYLLGGNEEQVVGSIKLLFGNLAGLVCDGAKYGCALKVGTSASVAVESALLSMDGVYISDSDGIIGCSLKETLHNLGVLHKKGMAHVDQTILDVILAKEDVRCEYETQR